METVGLVDTIRELRKYDKEMYFQVVNRLKSAADPLAREVGWHFGQEPPLENWHTSGGRRGQSRFPAWQPGKAARSVKAVVSTRPGGVEKVNLLRVQQMDAAGVVYDWAGGRAGPNNRFVKNLDKHRARKSVQGRYRSRVLFPWTKELVPSVEEEINKAIESANALVEKRIKSGG